MRASGAFQGRPVRQLDLPRRRREHEVLSQRGRGSAALRPNADHIGCQLWLADLRDLSTAINHCGWALDLDADPVAVDDLLSADPVLAPYVAMDPRRRVPRTADGPEFAVRAVLGQQVSTAAARTLAARLVLARGEPVIDPAGGLTNLSPEPAALVELDPSLLATPQTRRNTLTASELYVDSSRGFACRCRARAGPQPVCGKRETAACTR